MGTKRCVGCREFKATEAFSKKKDAKDGLQSRCIACYASYRQDNRETLVEQRKQYYQDNRETIAERNKQYYQDNQETLLERKKQYRQDNQETIAERNKQYHQDNRETLVEQMKQYRATQAAERPFVLIHRNAVQHRLDKGLADRITPEQIEALYEAQNGLCAYSGDPMPLEYLAEIGHPYAPSLERLDCTIGHIEANCVIIRRMLNNARKATCLQVFLGYLDSEVLPGFTRPSKVTDYLSALGEQAA